MTLRSHLFLPFAVASLCTAFAPITQAASSTSSNAGSLAPVVEPSPWTAHILSSSNHGQDIALARLMPGEFALRSGGMDSADETVLVLGQTTGEGGIGIDIDIISWLLSCGTYCPPPPIETELADCTKQSWCTSVESDNCTWKSTCTKSSKCTNLAGCTSAGQCTKEAGCTGAENCTGGSGCTSHDTDCTANQYCTDSDGENCTGSTACTQGSGCTDGSACTGSTGCTADSGCTGGSNCTTGQCSSGSSCTNGTACVTKKSGCTKAQGCSAPGAPGAGGRHASHGAIHESDPVRVDARSVKHWAPREPMLASLGWWWIALVPAFFALLRRKA